MQLKKSKYNKNLFVKGYFSEVEPARVHFRFSNIMMVERISVWCSG